MSEPGKVLRLAAGAAREAYTAARASHSREELAATTAMGADGTPTMLIDAYGRPLTFDTDLTRRWSGVVAATPAIAAELAELVRNAAPLQHSREPAGQ